MNKISTISQNNAVLQIGLEGHAYIYIYIYFKDTEFGQWEKGVNWGGDEYDQNPMSKNLKELIEILK